MSSARPVRAPRVDPAGRPLEGRRRQALQSAGVVALWILVMAGTFRLAGPASGGWLVAIGALSWPALEMVVGRHGLVWTGSAIGIVGALSAGVGVSIVTPEMRATMPSMQLAVVSGTAALMMGAFMLRFRLPGLVSPTVTFAIVASFLALYGADPARIEQLEGFSARGILSAMLDSPWAVAAFAALSAGSVRAARWLDLNGDDFGLAAARPLHLIGIGILALLVGRWLALLPQPLDMAALAAAWALGTLWALRINRFAVMVTAQLALAKPTFLAFGAWFGFAFTRADWSWALPAILIGGFAAWPLLHIRAMDRGFILGPGGRTPEPQQWRWWRYWPYA